MPHCNSCGKKGLFLKIEADSGLCLTCNEAFASRGKRLTRKITEAKQAAMTAKEPAAIQAACQTLVGEGEKLIRLHEAFQLPPSQELLELIETHRKTGDLADT